MKYLFVILSVFYCVSNSAQSDTLYLRNKQKIPVKLYEVSESQIKYRRSDLTDGPIYSTDVEKILKIKYANGTEQIFMVDELTVFQDVQDVVKQREAYKFHVFDLPVGKVSFGYERVIRAGINADFKAGYFNSNLFDNFNNSYSRTNLFNPYGSRFASGAFIKGGTKFLIGESFALKGMRYAHLLNGAFIRFDAYISYLKYEDVKYQIPVGPFNPQAQYPYTSFEQKSTDITNYNFGFLICIGKQHVLANILTLEYYVGLGFNSSSFSFTQSDFGINGPIYPNGQYNYYVDNYYVQASNVLAAQRLGKFMSGTVGFSIGYIHKSKDQKARTAVTK